MSIRYSNTYAVMADIKTRYDMEDIAVIVKNCQIELWSKWKGGGPSIPIIISLENAPLLLSVITEAVNEAIDQHFYTVLEKVEKLENPEPDKDNAVSNLPPGITSKGAINNDKG